jgi:hypothetical protein
MNLLVCLAQGAIGQLVGALIESVGCVTLDPMIGNAMNRRELVNVR